MLFNSGGAGSKVKPNEFGVLQGPGHTYTEGNQSVAGQSHNSAGNQSHQSNIELREQFLYKRQLHTNMTQRVLHQQQLRDSQQKQLLHVKGQVLSHQNSTVPGSDLI